MTAVDYQGDEMKNCPFCGSHRIEVRTTKKGKNNYAHCRMCFARGPAVLSAGGTGSESYASAWHEWNKREELTA